MHEVQRLCDEPVAPHELTKAKEYYKGRLLLGMEATDAVATRLGYSESLMGRVHTLEETLAGVDAVEASDVQRMARRLFVDQPLHAAVLGPFRSERPFRRQLRGE